MKLTLCAVGKLGATVENTLTRDYLTRAGQTGRALGLGPVDLIEVDSKKKTKPDEAAAIRSALNDGGLLITCDERGELLTSRAIAERLDRYKDRGERRVAFIIGGADGLDPALFKEATFSLAFGPQTWPHALVRVMLAEQIYRATTILAGLPYHRD